MPSFPKAETLYSVFSGKLLQFLKKIFINIIIRTAATAKWWNKWSLKIFFRPAAADFNNALPSKVIIKDVTEVVMPWQSTDKTHASKWICL